MLLSYNFLNEPVHKFEIICITVSFIGIVILSMSRPAGLEENVQELANKHGNEFEYLVGLLFALITMVLLAVLVVSGRALKGVNATLVQLHYAFWGSIFAAALMALFTKLPEGRTGLFTYEKTSTYWLLTAMGFIVINPDDIRNTRHI